MSPRTRQPARPPLAGRQFLAACARVAHPRFDGRALATEPGARRRQIEKHLDRWEREEQKLLGTIEITSDRLS